jgi:DNA-binding GntR family transcriptional regulator
MTSPAFERLPSYSLRGRIAETLREAILNGTLEEGQRLVERNLAAQLGASLTAVREALIELEMEGFIQKRRNAATYVTKLTLEDTEKIFAVRSVLEAYAVEQAALLAGPEHVERLEARYIEMQEAARANDRKAFLRADYSWHEAVWQITGNEYLQAALRRLLVPLFAFTAIRI